MKLKSKMTPDEFHELDRDIKYDVYAELYESLTHVIEQNERQYRLLELKDKLRIEYAFEIRLKHAEEAMHEGEKEVQASIQNDAVAALVALGYSNTEALKAVRQVEITKDTDVEDVLKAALKHMNLF